MTMSPENREAHRIALWAMQRYGIEDGDPLYQDVLATLRKAVPTWQPIETAPKEDLFEAIISNRRWVRFGTFIARKPGDDREGNGWLDHTGDLSPTHWMPLPSPPAYPPAPGT